MLLFIVYIIAQIGLGLYFKDFSLLAKSSDIFAVLSTISTALYTSDMNSLLRKLDDYLLESLFHKFERKYLGILESIQWRVLQTLVLIIVSLAFQFL